MNEGEGVSAQITGVIFEERYIVKTTETGTW
jgi:hypothetical protein